MIFARQRMLEIECFEVNLCNPSKTLRFDSCEVFARRIHRRRLFFQVQYGLQKILKVVMM